MQPNNLLKSVNTIMFGTIVPLPGAKHEEIESAIDEARKNISEMAKESLLVRGYLLGSGIYSLEKIEMRKGDNN